MYRKDAWNGRRRKVKEKRTKKTRRKERNSKHTYTHTHTLTSIHKYIYLSTSSWLQAITQTVGIVARGKPDTRRFAFRIRCCRLVAVMGRKIKKKIRLPCTQLCMYARVCVCACTSVECI